MTSTLSVHAVSREDREHPFEGDGHGELLDDDDVLALGVPFAEIPQRLGHLTQPIATVDDSSDLSGLAEFNDRRQVFRTQSNGKESYFLALGSSDQRPDQQNLQERSRRSANIQIPSPGRQ